MKTARAGVFAEQRGAALVFGIFFAVFLLACVYKLHGVLEVILYRQHQQDAADAAAFTAAVVNARGMNLIALINMTMAAVLAVLVGLRLAQTLLIIGIALCMGLAYPTAGNSMGYVPNLSSQTRTTNKAIKQVNKILPRVLSALHIAGKAVSVVIPLGSNARVYEVASAQYQETLGVALPGRFTLPVEDGKFIDLCGHAGALVAQIAMLPIKPFVGGRVEAGISKAGESIAAAAPDWFCGKQAKGRKPDLDPGGDLDPINLPVMPRQKRCNELGEKFRAIDEPNDQELAELDDACSGASVEYLASSPAQDGRVREGEPLCPSDCKTNPRPACPPADVEACEPTRSAEIDAFASKTGQSSIVASGPGSPYGQRLKLAHEQCDPNAPHSYPLGGFSWVQQEVLHRYNWNKQTQKFERDVSVDIVKPNTTLVRHKDEDRSIPCGDKGLVGSAYGKDPTNVCEDGGRCANANGTASSSGPCVPLLSTESYWKVHERVTGIVRCAELRPHEKVETPDVNMEDELNKSNTKSKNTSPFQIDKDAWLGGSDFQLRALVVGTKPGIVGGELVKLASWGKQEKPLDKALTELPETVGTVGLSQAEYYFDVGVFSQFANQQKQEDRVEWLWNQGWVSRLRSFRLSYKKADGPRSRKVNYDSEQAAFRDPNNKSAMPDEGLGEFEGKPGSDKLKGLLDQGGTP